jgi:hypothetical protein
MTRARQVLAVARADFLERVRRHAFVVTMGLTIYGGYLFLPPNFSPYATLRFDSYRGLYNSAWVGTVTAMLTATWLALAGFYLVKNAVERDRRSGVGAILAATPMTRLGYVLGKALSNFAVLGSIVLMVIVAAGAMQVLRGEDPRLDLFRLLMPFFALTLPAMAVVAAVAVLFEVVPLLRAGFGNVAYFVLWNVVLASSMARSAPGGLDFAGLGQILPLMARACHAAYPDYDPASGQMGFGFNFRAEGVWHLRTFVWDGIPWTGDIVAGRLLWVAVALGLVAIAAAVFDRFDEARAVPVERIPKGERQERMLHESHAREIGAGALPSVRLAPLMRPLSFSLPGLVLGELRLMRRDVSRSWLLVAGGLTVASLLAPLSVVLRFILPALWIWPLLLWSALGNREIRHDTGAMVFSTPRPLVRPLMAQWLAGVVVAMSLAIGVAARLTASGDFMGLAALTAGAMFVPALAVAFGAWTGSGKLFEVVYLLLWYVGPVNHAALLDFTGLSTSASAAPWVWWVATAALLLSAVFGRARSLAA